jgi:outer membrane protein assembly factor BamE (lipoprotein component of BamABCDE complex)
MRNLADILMFGGEIFGIPVFFIILAIIAIISSAQKEKEKARKEADDLWQGITLSLSKKQVADKLGRPQEIVAGAPETWVYTFKELKGYVQFENDVVVGYKRPE